MTSKYLVWLPLVAAVIGCSDPGNAPADGNGLATRVSAIRTGADCTAGYGSPPVGLEVVFDGQDKDGGTADFGFKYVIRTVDGLRVEADEIMLVGSNRSVGPTMPVIRSGGILTLRIGSTGSLRTYEYGPITEGAIRALKPSESVQVPVVETSNFQPGGAGEARGNARITFVGCSDLSVGETQEAVKVFDVESVGRARSGPAGGPVVDETVPTKNRYWVSERFGWPLMDQTADGSIQAVSIREPN